MTVMGFTDRKTMKNIEIPLNLYKYQAMSNALSLRETQQELMSSLNGTKTGFSVGNCSFEMF